MILVAAVWRKEPTRRPKPHIVNPTGDTLISRESARLVASVPMSHRITVDCIRTQVARILSSRTFMRSERLARFLRFTVDQSLQGNAASLKEFVLGIEVFDKGENFDPRMDPIVRVEARRLRYKLRKYYETEGREDLLLIELPKGSYVPVVQELDSAVADKGRADGRQSIVVLPFVNLGSEGEDEYFSDGLTEELISALTKIESLRVVAWNSAFQLKGKVRDTRRIAEQLDVDVILEGNVRRSGDSLRITAQLIRTSDGSYIWSDSYERGVRDVFAVQDEISAAVGDVLRLKLGGTASSLTAGKHTESLEAYHLYLKGRYYWNKRTEESLLRSIEFFQQSLAADPQYAPAYSGLADAYIIGAKYGMMRAGEAMPRAREAALRALEIDESSAEAHVSLASISAGHTWDWDAAETHYRRSLELNPSYATGHHWYAYDYLAPLGRMEDALVEIRLAEDLDPLSLIITTCVGELLSMNRQPDEAIEYCQKAIDLDSSFPRVQMTLGRAYQQKEMYEEAIACFEAARAMMPRAAAPLAVLGHVYALSGRRKEAEGLLAQLKQLRETRYVSPFLFARIYLALDRARALDYLEKACEERDPRLAHLKVSPVFDPLRAEPRFENLLRRMGLLEARVSENRSA